MLVMNLFVVSMLAAIATAGVAVKERVSCLTNNGVKFIS
jgi:hypothetical protein